MAETRESDVGSAPSPLPPTEAELAAWRALTRDEQLARYREALRRPECQRIGDAAMAAVMARARRRVAARRNG